MAIAIDKPSKYFNTVTYTGNGSTQSISNVSFQPDLVWLKNRTLAYNHGLWDSVRGATNALYSSVTNAEGVESGVSAFNSNGFSVGSSLAYNKSSDLFISWNWLGANTTVSNTAGTITSTVSANTTSGFSIVSWTGSGAVATIGHGIGVAPKIIIVKRRSGASEAWPVDCRAVSGIMYLNETGAKGAYGNVEPFPTTAPTSSVFSVGSAPNANASGSPMIAYCFAEIKGYSKFGSYTGNGSTDGTFVYTGFKPAMVIRKRTDAVQDWLIHDNKRTGINQTTSYTSTLKPNTSDAELGFNEIDILSNGFKCRASDTHGNASGGNYIYMAFAENPFVSSKGLPCTAR
jgi:hypothetical protein